MQTYVTRIHDVAVGLIAYKSNEEERRVYDADNRSVRVVSRPVVSSSCPWAMAQLLGRTSR
jgi:hypothetical protein